MRVRPLAVAAGALCALAAAPALAPAAPTDMRSGRFKVQLEGVQRTTWKTSHIAQFECDVTIQGSGAETVAFRSRPVVVDVDAFGRTTVVRRGRAEPILDLTATITRQGQVSTTGSAICADGDGGGDAPAAPDCGTRRSNLSVDLRYADELVTIEPNIAAPLDTFANCPQAGTSWPDLLTRDGRGRPIGRRLPVADLFGHGKNIVVGRGREVVEDFDTASTTTIRWELSFTRLSAATARRLS